MAFALFNVFEPSIVKHIYELAKEVKEIKITVLLYSGEWEDPNIFHCTVPKDATIRDLKVQLCEYDYLEGYSPDNLRLYVHQPWYRSYEELDDDDEEIQNWHNSYDEFHLDTEG